jgi:hypothetical protein
LAIEDLAKFRRDLVIIIFSKAVEENSKYPEYPESFDNMLEEPRRRTNKRSRIKSGEEMTSY